MKLYTEEQVKEVSENINILLQKYFPKECNDMYNNNQLQYEDIFLTFQKLIPIELPIDEEIDTLSKEEILYNDSKRSWWLKGAKWMREQILKQNK